MNFVIGGTGWGHKEAKKLIHLPYMHQFYWFLILLQTHIFFYYSILSFSSILFCRVVRAKIDFAFCDLTQFFIFFGFDFMTIMKIKLIALYAVELGLCVMLFEIIDFIHYLRVCKLNTLVYSLKFWTIFCKSRFSHDMP